MPHLLWFMLFKETLSLVHEAVFPLFCIECDKEGELLCTSCKSNPEPRMKNHCPYCRRVTPYGASCARHMNRDLDGVIAIYPYGYNRAKSLIRMWKYSFVREVELVLSKIVDSYCSDQCPLTPFDDPVIVALPLSSRRKRERGFDQAELLAQMLAESTRLSKMTVLNRIRSRRKHQADIVDKEIRRKQNLSKDFLVNTNCTHVPESVIIVDDVYTTGVTMSAAASALKRYGVGQVWGFVIARAD